MRAGAFAIPEFRAESETAVRDIDQRLVASLHAFLAGHRARLFDAV
jgi:hypothetical protein